jgi:hypothetical protein
VTRRIEDDKASWTAAEAALAAVADLAPQQRVDALFTALTTVAIQGGWSYETYTEWFLGSAKASYDGFMKSLKQKGPAS